MTPLSIQKQAISSNLPVVRAVFALALLWLIAAGAGCAHAGPPQQFGVASWHAGDGRTASDRPWINSQLVAAHRTLPLGSRVRVVNLANGREAIVEILDRGPFTRRRVIDVSRGAAQKLGLLEAGTALVRLEPLPAIALARNDS